MSGQKLAEQIASLMPDLRGRVLVDAPLADVTWFRVGGPADVLFTPEDEADLSYFLKHLPEDVPVMPIGVGSNLLVRDGGMRGVVIRLGRGFSKVDIEDGYRVRTGTAVPDMKVARAAGEAGIDGLSFYRGIPGAIGGALRMNAGAYGGETKDVLVEARAVDRQGNIHVLKNADFGYAYRHSSLPDDLIFTQALFQGKAGDKDTILAEMQGITERREKTQPVKSRTGGSTFKNPPENKSWQLIDAAGCRGLQIGDAQVSELHCNFLLNLGKASADDIETLGETVRAKVLANSGIQLEWEIKRIGEALS